MSLPTLPSETVYAGAAAPDSRARIGTPLSAFPEIAEPRTARILDFDSECMPDGYLGNDYTTSRLTAIAARFVGEPLMWCYCIRASRRHTLAEQSREMLAEFVALYNQADMVTGHNIRRHDLPMISASCVYFGLPPLKAKKTSDTLLDFHKSGRIFSRSQENLGEMLEVLDDKYHMNASRWKVANTLEDVTLTRERVRSDVDMHIQVREAMLARPGLLKAPKMWRP